MLELYDFVCEQSERTEAWSEKQLSVLSLYGGKKSSAEICKYSTYKNYAAINDELWMKFGNAAQHATASFLKGGLTHVAT